MKQSSEIAAKKRDWNPLREDLQRLLEGLTDVQLSTHLHAGSPRRA